MSDEIVEIDPKTGEVSPHMPTFIVDETKARAEADMALRRSQETVAMFFQRMRGDVHNANQEGIILLGIKTLLEREAVDIFNDIREFHEKFHQKYEGKPRTLPSALQKFREDTIQEEHDELKEAWTKGDRKMELDSIVDMIYFLVGTAYVKGYNIREAWRRVHAANMSKIPSESKELHGRGSKWDIVKPPGFVPPSMEGLC